MQLFTSPVQKQKFVNFDADEFILNSAFINDIEIDQLENDEFYSQAEQFSCEVLILSIKVLDVLTTEDEVYNEEYLAKLRQIFKVVQNHSVKVLFLPKIDKSIESKPELAIKSMKHTARRLKKFESIIGFVLPQEDCFKNEKVRQEFISELSEKHEHYKFVDLA
jgi:hypothetical protein